MILRPTPDPTWIDLKRLAWAWLLVLPFIAVASYGARELLGWDTAIRLGLWLAAFVTVVFLLIVVTSLVLSHAHERFDRRRERIDVVAKRSTPVDRPVRPAPPEASRE